MAHTMLVVSDSAKLAEIPTRLRGAGFDGTAKEAGGHVIYRCQEGEGEVSIVVAPKQTLPASDKSKPDLTYYPVFLHPKGGLFRGFTAGGKADQLLKARLEELLTPLKDVTIIIK